MQDFLHLVIYLIIASLLGGACLFAAGRLTSTQCTFPGMVLVVACSETFRIVFLLGAAAMEGAAAVLIIISWLGSLVLFFVLLKKFTQAPFFPDIVLMFVVFRFLTFLLGLFLLV